MIKEEVKIFLMNNNDIELVIKMPKEVYKSIINGKNYISYQEYVENAIRNGTPRDFCINCRKETEYRLQKKNIVKNIKGKEYTFAITVAVCAECGEEMSIPGLIDKNVQEVDEQYRGTCND